MFHPEIAIVRIGEGSRDGDVIIVEYGFPSELILENINTIQNNELDCVYPLPFSMKGMNHAQHLSDMHCRFNLIPDNDQGSGF